MDRKPKSSAEARKHGQHSMHTDSFVTNACGLIKVHGAVPTCLAPCHSCSHAPFNVYTMDVVSGHALQQKPAAAGPGPPENDGFNTEQVKTVQ